jgi:hypothetical protein
MPASAANGSQTTSGTTEHTLNSAAFTTAATYVLNLDLNPLAAGTTPDILRVRIYTKVLTGSTERTSYDVSYQGGLVTEPNVFSVPIPTLYSVKFTITMLQGSNRTIDWSVITL